MAFRMNYLDCKGLVQDRRGLQNSPLRTEYNYLHDQEDYRIARHGQPLHMFSDNGTNLKPVEKELRESYEKIDFERMRQKFTT